MIVEIQLLRKAGRAYGNAILIFKLEEEGKAVLLLLLSEVFAEVTVLVFAPVLRYKLVVGILQAVKALI